MAGNSEKRKTDHWELCSTPDVAFRQKTTLLEQVQLVHRALPELSLGEIDPGVEFLGRKLSAPLWIGSMTGGAEVAGDANRHLVQVAEQLGVGFCLGSMRPLFESRARLSDFKLRSVAPTALIMCNIGGTEVRRRGADAVLQLARDLEADGVIVHLNPAMELIQPAGDIDFTGVLDAIATLVDAAGDYPVCVKETGCGLSFDDARALVAAGVSLVETAGAGGTSWVGVETLRADGDQAALGEQLWDWGIPTAVTTSWCVEAGLNVVAGGGVRTGLDAARALALGAGLVAVAAPLVRAQKDGGAAEIASHLQRLIAGLKATMLLVGARRVADLQRVPRVIGPELGQWLQLSSERG